MTSTPNHNYVVYIDEAGDPGVRYKETDQPDAQDWFVVSAVVLNRERDKEAVNWVRDMKDAVRGQIDAPLHYRNLSDSNRERVCRMLGRKHARLFVVASHKQSMRDHRNLRLGRATDQHFYNFCLRLLLERVTEWALNRCRLDGLEPRPLKVVFAERGGHNYRELRAYLAKLEAQTLTGNLVLKRRGITPGTIRADQCHVRRAADVAGLQLADIVASAFYQAACTALPRHTTKPAELLADRMAKAKGSRVAADCGVLRLPFPSQGEIPATDRAIFERYGYRFED